MADRSQELLDSCMLRGFRYRLRCFDARWESDKDFFTVTKHLREKQISRRRFETLEEAVACYKEMTR
jgi:hypothetical protein